MRETFVVRDFAGQEIQRIKGKDILREKYITDEEKKLLFDGTSVEFDEGIVSRVPGAPEANCRKTI